MRPAAFSRPFLVLFVIQSATFATAQPRLIENGSDPREGVRAVALREQWRVGGEDDDIFFGNVLQVLAAPEGGLYILDSQLFQVFAFTAAGELQAVLGGRGEGPGEVDNVNSIINLSDGRLGIGQVLPGVVVCVQADGTPAGTIRIIDKDEPDTSFVLYLGGQACGERIVATIMRWRMGDPGTMGQEMYLRSFDLDGRPAVDFLHKRTSFDLADFRFTEAGYDFVWTRYRILPGNRVCFAPRRNEYEIQVWSADGDHQTTITREYESWSRSSKESEEARLSHTAIASQYGREVRGVTIEDTEPDITALAVLADGTMLVRTSRGDRQSPAGVLTTVDEIDTEGRFVRQTQLLAPGNPARDAVHMLADGRVVVVTGAVEAYRREQNTERSVVKTAEDTPLEVICYSRD